MTRRTILFLLSLGAFTVTSLGILSLLISHVAPRLPGPTLPPAVPLTPLQSRIIAGTRTQIGNGYNASYRLLSYPNGDPPAGQGACTDVVVRSLRAGGCDLQALVHEDMTRHWDQYPHRWGLPGPDPNIDHRRVPNLAHFFQRYGQTLPVAVTPKTLTTWQPGDVVMWRMPGGGDHCGIVSDRRDLAGTPLVIHNLGRVAEQDVLTSWTISGHYRYPTQPQTRRGPGIKRSPAPFAFSASCASLPTPALCPA